MNIDCHIVTCHHSEVKCRARPQDPFPHFNITEWDQEEKFEISKRCIESVERLMKICESQGHHARITITDDGSDYQPFLDWARAKARAGDLWFLTGNRRGPAGVLNRYMETIPDGVDLVLHVEDDNLAFNPLEYDWATNALTLLQDPEVGCVQLFTGVPTEDSLGHRGAFSPVGAHKGHPVYRFVGGSSNIMTLETCRKIFPFDEKVHPEGQYSSRIIETGGYMLLLQAPVYMFHTHKLRFPMPEKGSDILETFQFNEENELDTTHLNLTGYGFEVGMEDMDEWFKAKKPIRLSWRTDFPRGRTSVKVEDYFYD